VRASSPEDQFLSGLIHILCHSDSAGTKQCPATESYGWLSDAKHGYASPKSKKYLVLEWQKLELLENCRLSSSYSSKSCWFNGYRCLHL